MNATQHGKTKNRNPMRDSRGRFASKKQPQLDPALDVSNEDNAKAQSCTGDYFRYGRKTEQASESKDETENEASS
jgi:hypothetical protein